jgi:transposase-like protein
MYMRKSRLSKAKQGRLTEHFVAGTTASCAAGKVPVFGILKRGGKVYTKVIADTKTKTLMGIMQK